MIWFKRKGRWCFNFIYGLIAFYFIPTACYVQVPNGNQSFMMYFGNLCIEVVYLSRGGMDELDQREEAARRVKAGEVQSTHNLENGFQ